MNLEELQAYEELLLAKVKPALQSLLEKSGLVLDLAVKKGLMELAKGLDHYRGALLALQRRVSRTPPATELGVVSRRSLEGGFKAVERDLESMEAAVLAEELLLVRAHEAFMDVSTMEREVLEGRTPTEAYEAFAFKVREMEELWNVRLQPARARGRLVEAYRGMLEELAEEGVKALEAQGLSRRHVEGFLSRLKRLLGLGRPLSEELSGLLSELRSKGREYARLEELASALRGRGVRVDIHGLEAELRKMVEKGSIAAIAVYGGVKVADLVPRQSSSDLQPVLDCVKELGGAALVTELSEKLGWDLVRVERALRGLQDRGLLICEGSAKWRVKPWEVKATCSRSS